MLYKQYFEQVGKMLESVQATQTAGIEAGAHLITESWKQDGMLYVFGCGHSHIIGEDLFYRAGGTASICAMLDSDLMLHGGAVKSSHYEKMTGLAAPIFQRYQLTKRDVLMVVSTSGINSVPIEMAMCAREQGIPVIAIVSMAYQEDVSRHPSGKKLCEVADIVIDNCVCHGDAAVQLPGTAIYAGPISTISSCYIAQAMVIQADEELLQAGITPPIYVSGNIPGGMERNQNLIERYMPRIKHL